MRGSYQQFLRIAQGSLKELETQLLIAERTASPRRRRQRRCWPAPKVWGSSCGF
ncbi:four helix bundle protein [Mesorhizobium sp. B2-3-8]|uniref:four helix bundle protein n=1 Tax=unclassified Mesorhizobium TaxID=325217 RepID=UPI0032B1160E